MNIKKTSIITLITIIIASVTYDSFYTAGMVSGMYAYDFPLNGPDGPHQGDKLLLKKDGTFQSDSWGDGTYKIKFSDLELYYNYEFGRAGYEMTIYRPFYWGRPRLCVVRDLNYYFEKQD